MRLTESLVKALFGRAVAAGRTKELNAAFKEHLSLADQFEKMKDKKGKMVWKPITFQGYECYRFSK
jgi:hypothetical protein